MRTWCLLLMIGGVFANAATAQSLVYTGYEVTFEKVAFADETLPENQDFILNGISITRGSTRGIYNIAQEEFFEDFVSPLGTAWAFPNNNPAVTLSAANCADGCSEYVFEDWQTANGGAGGGPPATVDQDAIVHLIDQDVYLDIRFTSWAMGFGAGGAFSYERAVITPSADFDRDGDVDGRDFLTWQRNYGATEVLQSEGDADFDGVVSGDDLIIWQDSYGSALTAVSTVPEPGSILLAAVLTLGITFRRLN
jgi:hypothetical protein